MYESIVPGDPGYDEARSVFNAMIDRRPALIARCRTAADVAHAVDHAREQGLLVAVRAGGHSAAGLSMCDDGIVIDLRGLDRIAVDPVARTVRAGGGALWGALDAVTQAHGLHVPGGRVSTTGVGGFTLGGGFGWTSSKHGLACDNLLSAEVVLADGSVVTAGEREHEDLFWAIRGGGGNFGIVTEFEFRLHQLGPTVLAGLALWPLERAGEALRGWRDAIDGAPDELSSTCVTLMAPPEPFVPEQLRGCIVLAMAAMYVGDPDEGASVVQRLRDLQPDVDLIGPTTYLEFQASLDAFAPEGARSYWRGEYLRELSDGAIDVFLEHAPALTAAGPPFSQMVLLRTGQGITAVPEDATAFSHRDAGYLFHPISLWMDPADDARLIAGNRAFADAMRPFTTGATYLNFTSETADRVRAAYGEAKYQRLQAIKDRYDPRNLFRLNHNIEPSMPPARV